MKLLNRQILLFLFLWGFLFAQITFKNQLEYAYWKIDKNSVFENWSDLGYRYSYFYGGLRYDINDPPDANIYPDVNSVQRYNLAMRFAEINYKSFYARLGNSYTMYGRGIILRTYEDRNLRVDNNIDGLKLKYEGDFFSIQALGGSMRNLYDRRGERIYGIDGDINPTQNSMIGGSVLAQDPGMPDHRSLWGLRGEYSGDSYDLYGELAKIDNGEELSYYFSFNYYLENMSLLLEYKDYNHLDFRNSAGESYNAGPSTTRQHAYSLLNRHPHALDMSDEKGYQAEITWSPDERWEFLFNNSQTFAHSTLKLFEEYYFEARNDYGEELEILAALSWIYDKSSNTKNITPLVDIQYNLSRKNLIHIVYQHQHTANQLDKSEFDTENLLLEFSRSPLFSIALVGEYTNEDQLINRDLERNKWLYASTTINFLHSQQLTVLYGSRQGGYVCVGGICRYEPAFEGLEVKVLLRF